MLSVHSTRHDQSVPLSQCGFTEYQLICFRLFHTIYRTGYFQLDPVVVRRLEFARWLYQHGKLSEE